MRKDLLINDVSLNSMGIYISSDTYLNSPLMDYTEFQVPGRDGTLILDNKRLNNVIRQFDCYIPETQNVETALKSLKQLIYFNRGYVKIVSDYDPNVYQYGYFAQELNVEPFITKSATFSLYFSCLPRKYFPNNEYSLGEWSYNRDRIFIGFYKNDDPKLVALLANAVNDYPYSPMGWLVSSNDRTAFHAGTYSLKATSETIQKYIVVFEDYGTNEWIIAKEVSNYNEEFEFTSTSQGLSTGKLYIACPLTITSEIEASVVDTGDNDRVMVNLHRSFISIQDEHLINDEAFGSTPVFCIQKTVSTGEYQIGRNMDVFWLNNSIYWVDFFAFIDDYGVDYIRNSLAVDNKLNYILDCANLRAFIVSDFDVDAGKVLDITNYVRAETKESYSNEVALQYGFVFEYEAWPLLSFDIALKSKMGWWKL